MAATFSPLTASSPSALSWACHTLRQLDVRWHLPHLPHSLAAINMAPAASGLPPLTSQLSLSKFHLNSVAAVGLHLTATEICKKLDMRITHLKCPFYRRTCNYFRCSDGQVTDGEVIQCYVCDWHWERRIRKVSVIKTCSDNTPSFQPPDAPWLYILLWATNVRSVGIRSTVWSNNCDIATETFHLQTFTNWNKTFPITQSWIKSKGQSYSGEANSRLSSQQI